MSPRRTSVTSGLVLVAIFAGVASLHAYVLLGPVWPTGATTFRVNPNFPVNPGGTTLQQIAAVRCAASAWRQQGQANINVNYLGTTASTSLNPADLNNIVFWSSTNPGGGVLATTFSVSAGPNFVGWDMVFFSNNAGGPISWNGVGDPSPSQFDIIGTGTHEFGHVIGLDHSPIAAATMFAFGGPGEPGCRTLHADDIAGTQFLYGFNPTINDEPLINDVDPPEGPVGGGNAVTLTGENFTWETNTLLRIDGVILSSAFWNLDNCGTIQITSMPAHAAGFVSISVDNELGSVILNDAYLYGGLPPIVSQVSPSAGTVGGGNQVSIFGQNLAPSATVIFGTQFATGVTQVSSTELLVTVPAGPGSNIEVDVIVTQASGTDTLTNGYLYTNTALRIESLNAPIGGTVLSRGIATSDVELAAFSCAVDFEGTFANVVGVTLDGTLSFGADFFQSDWSNSVIPGENWWLCGVIMSVGGVNPPIPAGVEFPIVAVEYEIEPFTPPGTFITLDLVDGAGSPPTALVFVPPSGTAIAPTAIDGVLIAIDGGFVRGDGNQDGTVDVADPVYSLAFLFSMGPGLCPDSMDGNDDGAIDIADPVYLLAFLFSNGPPPPPPFPNEGGDPTPDALGCS